MRFLAHLLFVAFHFDLLGKWRRIIRSHTVSLLLPRILLNFFKALHHMLELTHVAFFIVATIADFWQK